MKILAAGAAALLMAGTASAQGGQGQQRPRPRPPEPENSVAPLRVTMPPPAAVAPVAPALTPENTWVLDLTNGGRVRIQLRPDVAPRHVERIKTLTRRGFYNGLSFHRVIEGFMAQSGDPNGNGLGESDLPDLAAEFNALPHLRGAVAMARASDPNSANSQFYIMYVPRFSMDGDYTVFGRVVQGMDVIDRIQRGEPPAQPTRIVRASIGSDNAPIPTAEEVAAVAARNQPAQAALPVLDVRSLTGGTGQGAQPAPARPNPGAATPPR
jgi:peptidylprolyl isomerase